jgi:hypothetical protein
MSLSRRTLLKALACAGAAYGGAAAMDPFLSAFADPAESSTSTDEFFVFVHAGGGWDVTLWSDPRNEKVGLIDPATTDTVDPSGIRHWVDQAPAGGTGAHTFRPVTPKGTPFSFGPGIGNLFDIADRLTVVNGLAMNTVSHPDGTIFSATGRHSIAGRVVASSIDTMMANELGRTRMFPTLSVGFPSYYVGNDLDRRVVPLRVGTIGAVTRLLSRSEAYETTADRQEVTAILSEEAHDLAARSANPDLLTGLSVQYEALEKMIGGSLEAVFSVPALQRAHPELNYGARFAASAAVSAAFAVEAMRRNLVRCVSFSSSGFDTHTNNYRQQALVQQELFDLIAALVQAFDRTPHPTRPEDRLSDHAHILVVSDFCRTPQINQAGGRDHYPNNSALVISPRFRHPFLFGKSDPEQLLPAPVDGFSDGPRPIAPPDLLATFVHAFGIDPRKYLRDGEVVTGLLKA